MNAQDLEQRAEAILREVCAGDPQVLAHLVGDMVPVSFALRAIVAALRQQPAPVDPDAMQEHIEWVHSTLRANGCCIDGGKCHHRCDPKDECFRQRGCVPLSGSRLTDDWKLPGHQPAPVVFRNDGNSEADFIAHHADACTACGGSGHKSDQQPAPVVDDARMARALEWVRWCASEFSGTLEEIAVAKACVPAIEEAIAAYNPNCGARTVRVVDDALLRWIKAQADDRSTIQQWFKEYHAKLSRSHGHSYEAFKGDYLMFFIGGAEAALTAALARAQGVQS